MGRPIVYGTAGSTYVWSVRLALAEKGVAHELVEVGFGAHREEPHLSRHPFAKIPAFEHDGFQLYETQAILRYIDEGFPVAPLQSTDLHQFSRMNQIMGIVDAYAWPSIAAGILFNGSCDEVRPGGHRTIPGVDSHLVLDGSQTFEMSGEYRWRIPLSFSTSSVADRASLRLNTSLSV